MDHHSTHYSGAGFVPIFTDLSAVEADSSGRGTYTEQSASASATNLGQLITLLFASVERTGRLSAMHIAFAPHPNFAAIRLLQEWIDEDRGVVSPTLSREMQELDDARLSLRRW
jgi:hypothetical protein